jgi:hypothetical protein
MPYFVDALSRKPAFWLLVAVGAGWLAGCAHKPDLDIREGGYTRVFTPQVPVFLSGPAAVLLTNTPGFTARVTFQGDELVTGRGPVEGDLFGRGSKLFFAPKQGDPAAKKARDTGFSYLWDVSASSGYIFSEALQAYAPVSSSLRPTNVVIGTAQTGARDATVNLDNGSSASFRIEADSGHKGLPFRIQSLTSSPPISLTLSKIRLQPPPPDLFAPPDGFSKYPTPEALADELAARQQNLRRRGHAPESSSDPGVIRR